MREPASTLAVSTTPMTPDRTATPCVLPLTSPDAWLQAVIAHALIGAGFGTIERFGFAVARRLGRQALARDHEGQQSHDAHAQSTFRTSAIRLGAPTFLRTFAACILTVRFAIERTSPISS